MFFVFNNISFSNRFSQSCSFKYCSFYSTRNSSVVSLSASKVRDYGGKERGEGNSTLSIPKSRLRTCGVSVAYANIAFPAGRQFSYNWRYAFSMTKADVIQLIGRLNRYTTYSKYPWESFLDRFKINAEEISLAIGVGRFFSEEVICQSTAVVMCYKAGTHSHERSKFVCFHTLEQLIQCLENCVDDSMAEFYTICSVVDLSRFITFRVKYHYRFYTFLKVGLWRIAKGDVQTLRSNDFKRCSSNAYPWLNSNRPFESLLDPMPDHMVDKPQQSDE